MTAIHKYSENYLFESHSKETVRNWLNNIKYFYFNRAWGGHANDGDCFVAFFKINNENELITIANKIGIQLEILPENNPKPIKGKKYTSSDFNKFKTEITNFPKYKQPGRTLIQEIESFLWVDQNNILKISISGSSDKNYYVVSEQDFKNSLKLEAWFYKNGLKPLRNEEIEQRATIISRSKYFQLLYPKKITKHIKFIQERLKKQFEIYSIEYLKSLPMEINYVTWSINDPISTVDIETDKNFKILAKNNFQNEIELYVQTKSIFGFIFRALYWQKNEQKYERIEITKA